MAEALEADPMEVPMGIVHDVPTSMDSEVRDLWVAGLRSGIYTEGRGFLRTLDNRFDPFGVLCDIGADLGYVVWDHNRTEDIYHIYGHKSTLPVPIRQWAKLKGMHPAQDVPLTLDDERHPMWRLVDRYKLDHLIIADLIEAQY